MNKWINDNWLKLVAILMLLGVLAPFLTRPYAYYQIMEWVVVGASVITAWQAHKQGREVIMWIFICTTVLLNPLAPLYFSNVMWQILDISVAILFGLSFIFVKSPKKK